MHKKLFILIIAFCFSNIGQAKQFSDYSSYKDWILSKVAKAKKNVWIKTNSFDDYDLYYSLILSKSLKRLNVKVLLSGPSKDKSMLKDLKDAGVAVENFNSAITEDDYIRIDNKTYKLQGEFNPYINQKKFLAERLTKTNAGKMVAEFWNISNPKTSGTKRQAYYYKPPQNIDSAPEGVPRSLPKKPLYLKNNRL